MHGEVGSKSCRRNRGSPGSQMERSPWREGLLRSWWKKTWVARWVWFGVRKGSVNDEKSFKD